MPPELGPRSAEEFLREDRWLRALVRSLTREELVDDVVQNTWIAALGHWRGVRAPRAFLGKVARNFVFREYRNALRREDREALASKPEALPSTEETLAWIELQREVARAVQELSEPHRTAMLLHYTHGVAVAEIAERTGTSEANVRQRLKRGRDRLRRTLADSIESDGPQGSPLALWWLPEVVQMKLRKSFVAVLLLVICAPLAVWSLTRSGPEPDVDAPREAVLQATSAPDLSTPKSTPASRDIGERRALESDANKTRPTPTALATVRGRAMDPQGDGLAGVGLSLASEPSIQRGPQGLPSAEAIVRTARDGSFELDTPNRLVHWLAEPGWVVVAQTTVRESDVSRRGAKVLLAPAVTRTGSVLDIEGRPLEEVQVIVGEPQLLDFPRALDRYVAMRWSPTRTDELGTFSYRDLPARCVNLRFEKAGFQPQEVDLSTLREEHLEIVLERQSDLRVLSGYVLDPNGAVVPSALVGIGEHSTLSADDGRYRLELPREALLAYPNQLYAAAHPWRTLLDEALADKLLKSEDGPLERDLVFEEASLHIEGQLVDAHGEPVSGFYVFLWHEGALTASRCAEDLAQPLEAPVLDIGPGLRAWAETDEDGAFEIGGLSDREYNLRFLDRSRMAGLTVKEVPAGTEGRVFELPEDFIVAEITGRVLARDGSPVAGVNVRGSAAEFLSHHQYISVHAGEPTRTDEEGRFTLRDLPGWDLAIEVTGVDILRHSVGGAGRVARDLVVTVDRRCNFRVLVDDPDLSAVGFEVHDEHGKPLMVAEIGAGSYGWSSWGSITDGRTRVLSTGQNAKTLVLYAVSEGRRLEVARREITLSHEDVTNLRF